MKAIKEFEGKKLKLSESLANRGGKRIVGDTPGKGRDVSVIRDGQVDKFITGSGLFDGVPRD